MLLHPRAIIRRLRTTCTVCVYIHKYMPYPIKLREGGGLNYYLFIFLFFSFLLLIFPSCWLLKKNLKKYWKKHKNCIKSIWKLLRNRVYRQPVASNMHVELPFSIRKAPGERSKIFYNGISRAPPKTQRKRIIKKYYRTRVVFPSIQKLNTDAVKRHLKMTEDYQSQEC